MIRFQETDTSYPTINVISLVMLVNALMQLPERPLPIQQVRIQPLEVQVEWLAFHNMKAMGEMTEMAEIMS